MSVKRRKTCTRLHGATAQMTAICEYDALGVAAKRRKSPDLLGIQPRSSVSYRVTYAELFSL